MMAEKMEMIAGSCPHCRAYFSRTLAMPQYLRVLTACDECRGTIEIEAKRVVHVTIRAYRGPGEAT